MVNKNLMEMSNEYIHTVGKKSVIYPNLVDGNDVRKYITSITAPNPVLSDNDG